MKTMKLALIMIKVEETSGKRGSGRGNVLMKVDG